MTHSTIRVSTGREFPESGREKALSRPDGKFTVFLSLIADLDFLVTTCVVGGYKWHVIYLIDLWRIFFINKIF